VKTTLYFSNNAKAGKYPYNALNKKLEELGFRINQEEHSFLFEDIEISYKLRHKYSIMRYILSFSLKRPRKQLTSKETKRRYDIICSLIDKLPEEIDIGSLKFTRTNISDKIDMNHWEVKDSFTFEKVNLFDKYSYKKLRSLYEDKIRLKPIFMVLNKSTTSKLIINALRPFFSEKEEIIETSINLVREKINNRIDRNRIFLFILYNENCDQYVKLKKFFLQNNIPSQFINMNNKNFWFKTINLIPEILTKASCYPFEFPEGLSKVDGYICLTDIYDEKTPLFGINITYNSEEKGSFKNTIKIYSDIKYVSNRFSIKNFIDDNLSLLVGKIASLGSELVGKKVNIYLTKYWKTKDIYFLIEKLENNNITVKKIFYISFFSDKFVFKGMESLKETEIPYIIKDKYLAYLQPNTIIGLFGSLFPISLELANIKNNEVITKDDIEEYLWLIKRRVYRLQYITMLRYPEFIKFIKKIRELNLSEENLSKLTLNGDLLI